MPSPPSTTRGSRVAGPAGLALVERELGAYGIDVVPTGEAIGALGEACVIARRMWTETEPFDFDGRWYQLHGAICEPKPVQRPGPPVMIGDCAAVTRRSSKTRGSAMLLNLKYGLTPN